jgi:death on curing protein
VDPTFLTLDEVIEIHRDMIERYGGRPGIRDQGLLESAVAMAQAGFGEQYLHSTVFEMAAAYLFHIVNNHAFVDGNKRTGAMAAFTFLKLNQFSLGAGEVKFERLVRETAEGKVGKEKIAEFFQKNSKKRR